jgi:hypothetical protein
MIDTYVLADGDAHAFHHACREAGLKPVYHPFWERLPLVDIFISITPDILHQMLQGMVKHLIHWLVSIFGAAGIDTRCKAIPPNHKIMIFTKGIATLSRVSGHEHKKMCSIILGLIVDLPIPGGQNSSRMVKAVRALLDFLFLAQYQCHTAETISRLDDSLSAFHENKAVFIDLGVREHFNFPKLHSLIHYASSIRLFGTTDNYNTEQSERLHIEFTKDAYRATNHKDEYPQMTLWLERCEKIQQHAASIERRQQNLGDHQHADNPVSRAPLKPLRAHTQRIKLAQKPSIKTVSFREIPGRYGAHLFQDALADFIARFNNPGTGRHALHRLSADTLLPFRTVHVYHNIKFTKGEELEIIDAIYARPEQKDTRGRIIPSRFDTVLVQGRGQGSEGIKGMFGSCACPDLINRHRHTGHRIAQVRIVFQIPRRYIEQVLVSTEASPPTHLAYVEWFTPLPAMPEPKHLMYKVSRMMSRGYQCADIIPVESILRSVHLIPRFGPTPQEWSSYSVLEQCHTFYVNPFTDIDNYLTFV